MPKLLLLYVARYAPAYFLKRKLKMSLIHGPENDIV
jgi:hypothetical protein